MGLRSLVGLVGIGGLLCGLAWWIWTPDHYGERVVKPPPEGAQSGLPTLNSQDVIGPSATNETSDRQPASTYTTGTSTDSPGRFSHPEWAPFSHPMEGRIFAAPRAELGETEPRVLADFEVEFFTARSRRVPVHFKRIKTDELGRFALDLAPLRDSRTSAAEICRTTWELWPADVGRKLSSSRLDLKRWLSNPEQSTDFILEDTGTIEISGTVLDSNGQPLSKGYGMYTWDGYGYPIWIDDRARFESTTRIPRDPSQRYSGSDGGMIGFTFSDGQGAAHFEEINSMAWDGHRIDLGTFFLPDRGVGDSLLQGQLFAMDWTPLPHWPLTIWRGPAPSRKTERFLTDETGFFSIRSQSGKEAELRLQHSDGPPTLSATPPMSALDLRLEEHSIVLSCIDPEGIEIPMRSYWRIQNLATDAELKFAHAVEMGGKLYATTPETGEYQVQASWMGLLGEWTIDQCFEIGHGHQEVVLQAEYSQHSASSTDNSPSEGDSTPKIR